VGVVASVQLLASGVDLCHKVVQIVDLYPVGADDRVLISLLSSAFDAGDEAGVAALVVVNPDVGIVPPGRGRVRHLKLES